jgi:hypothetical protein
LQPRRGHEGHEGGFFAQRRKGRKEKDSELGALGVLAREVLSAQRSLVSWGNFFGAATVFIRVIRELAAEYHKTFKRLTPLEPEKKLMFAVLEDAIICFQRFLRAKNSKQKKLHQEAVSWIFDRSDNWVFSFENICAACGLDPDYLRMGLLNWMHQRKPLKAPRAKLAQAGRIAVRQWGMRGHKR